MEVIFCSRRKNMYEKEQKQKTIENTY